jgi:NAD-dependent deacetylase
MNLSEKLQRVLAEAKSVCVLTGAGVSAESGVPTFRGNEGLWSKFRPEELANFDAFIKNPKLVWEWYAYRKRVMSHVQPNTGHLALVEMESLCEDFTLVTQNVDNLHTRAGSKRVVELHGNIERSYCISCRGRWTEPITEENIPPRCKHCGGLIRPDVVWFGELLPQENFDEAAEASRRCDLFLCVGTSAVVYPAASLPLMALENGAYVVEINPEYTELSSRTQETLLGNAGVILPQVVHYLKTAHIGGT